MLGAPHAYAAINGELMKARKYQHLKAIAKILGLKKWPRNVSSYIFCRSYLPSIFAPFDPICKCWYSVHMAAKSGYQLTCRWGIDSLQML